LSDEDHEKLADGLVPAPFAKGETMTKQGAEAHWLYMIVSGEASVRVAVEGGLERDVAQLKAGSFFGEMSLMTGAPRSATVVALTDIECYRLYKRSFEEIIQRRPDMAEGIAAAMAKRKVDLDAVREGLAEAAKHAPR